jgi:alkaline phosphatase D
MCTRVFEKQPVWDQIAALNPDYLVLLGDSIYIDINVEVAPSDPSEMDEVTFGQHVFSLYTELIHQPQFSNLVKKMPAGRVFSIWDDHDFLWNDMYGASAEGKPIQREKVRITTAFQKAFRSALAQSFAENSFPNSYDDSVFWDQGEPPLATPSIELGEDVWLHLCDARSFRTSKNFVAKDKRTILGSVQRQKVEAAVTAAVKAAPNSVHLIASGSTLASWNKYPQDMQWLLQLASANRLMVLSGDIHKNHRDLFQTAGLPLHELTSSGAAIRSLVVIGDEQQNFGYIDIDASKIDARFFHFGQRQTALDRTYDRGSWA